MTPIFSRHPSPAMAVAFIGLLVALGGTAVALPGSNTVRSDDIVNGQVRTRDVRDNNLTGQDINESTLGTVPSANTANSIGGVAVLPVFIMIARDTGATTIFDLAGLKLTVACPAGALAIVATTSVNDSVFASQAQDSAALGGTRSGNFDIGVTLNPIAGLVRGHVTLNYAQPTGQVVTAALSVDDSNTFGTFDGCGVSGVVMSDG